MRSVFRNRTSPAAQRRHLWALFGVALVLHGVVDPALTLLALEGLHTGRELNPLLRRGVAAGIPTFLAMYLVFIGCACSLFWGITQLMQRGTLAEHRRLYRGGVVVLWGMIIWGIGIVLWNLSVVL